MRRHFGALLLVGAFAATAGCSSSSDAEPEVTAPLPPTSASAAPGTDASTTVATSTPPDVTSTAPETSTVLPSSTAPTTGFLPADLGPRRDSVAGVDTPGEIVELADMVFLFVPTAADPDDANVAVPLPEDAEIITAYGRAMTALYDQVTQNPIPVEPSEAMRATFLDGGAKYSANVFAPRNSSGEHLGFLGENDILRPVVLADPRSDTEAFIFDCAISGSHYLNSDGTLATGETPGTVLAPMLVRLVNETGTWIVDDIQDDERACT